MYTFRDPQYACCLCGYLTRLGRYTYCNAKESVTIVVTCFLYSRMALALYCKQDPARFFPKNFMHTKAHTQTKRPHPKHPLLCDHLPPPHTHTCLSRSRPVPPQWPSPLFMPPCPQVRSLGRGGGWGPLRRAPVQNFDVKGRPGLLRTVLEAQETRGLTRSDDISRLLPAEAAMLARGRTVREGRGCLNDPRLLSKINMVFWEE